jgi:glycerophosphoryl diester phosphodiesterase family protein
LSSPPERVDLNRPRDLNALISDSFGLYRRHFWTFLAIAVAVEVPVDSVVLGVGLGQFTGGYNSTPVPASSIVPVLVRLLVATPLVAVMVLDALVDISAGRKPRAAKAIQAGLDAFTRVFWPVLIAVACEAAALVTIVLTFVLIVRWFFVPQVVVMENKRGTEALRASWELTRGFSWRVAGLVLIVQLLFVLAGGLVATPVAALAKSLDSEAVQLAANTLAETVVAAPLGIFAALLYFDLRSRHAALTG